MQLSGWLTCPTDSDSAAFSTGLKAVMHLHYTALGLAVGSDACSVSCNCVAPTHPMPLTSTGSATHRRRHRLRPTLRDGSDEWGPRPEEFSSYCDQQEGCVAFSINRAAGVSCLKSVTYTGACEGIRFTFFLVAANCKKISLTPAQGPGCCWPWS